MRKTWKHCASTRNLIYYVDAVKWCGRALFLSICRRFICLPSHNAFRCTAPTSPLPHHTPDYMCNLLTDVHNHATGKWGIFNWFATKIPNLRKQFALARGTPNKYLPLTHSVWWELGTWCEPTVCMHCWLSIKVPNSNSDSKANTVLCNKAISRKIKKPTQKMPHTQREWEGERKRKTAKNLFEIEA